MTELNRTVAVAPMLDWTDRHCRYFHRLISPQTLLYTEMITAPAILRGDRKKVLDFSAAENPVALQLGGSDPQALAECARIAEDLGYQEINLNVGCPSDRVQKGRFGACLMKEPELVADCIDAMQNATVLPVTVKSRIGVDDQEGYDQFRHFIDAVAAAGCNTFIVHARKAWLQGLSPKQNRTVPELKYDYVYRLKKERPELTIQINGGINDVAAVESHLQQTDGVMIGRAVWNAPWLLYDIDTFLQRADVNKNRDTVLSAYQAYCEEMLLGSVNLHWMIRPILGLFHGLPGNKKWKSYLVTESPRRPKDVSVITEARAFVHTIDTNPNRHKETTEGVL
ncbi:tRNA dihydrouridine(20/20a) synthase DusA [Marinicella sp. W31]|uniref:tRNA dihydrouridine(20/20a) synthase DusA n=1 Tax=Marinicella sp. W31 TaxID=3023713 RepID=UPI0037583BC5